MHLGHLLPRSMDSTNINLWASGLYRLSPVPASLWLLLFKNPDLVLRAPRNDQYKNQKSMTSNFKNTTSKHRAPALSKTNTHTKIQIPIASRQLITEVVPEIRTV
jgi:hypothetical protein